MRKNRITRQKIEPEVLSKKEITDLLTKLTQEEFDESIKHSLTQLAKPNYKDVMYRGIPGTAWFETYGGKKILDCTGQAWVLTTGFVNPDTVYAAMEQAKMLNHHWSDYTSVVRVKLINELAKTFPEDLNQVSLNCEGGGLAIEAAMKLAMVQKYGKNQKKIDGKFIVTSRSYHGATLSTISASEQFPSEIIGRKVMRFEGAGIENFVREKFPYCYRCPSGKSRGNCSMECLNTMQDTIKKNIRKRFKKLTGIIIEPIQGAGGQIPAPKKYLEGLRELCNQYNLSLIFDESQTAFGKIGKMSAAEYYNVIPDIMVLTKSFGGGFPGGAIIAREEYEKFTAAEEHTTFSANPVLAAAALINLKVIKRKKIPKRAEMLGDYITGKLKEMEKKYGLIGDIRGPGLFIGVELVEDRKTKEPAWLRTQKFLNVAWEEGVMFGNSAPYLAREQVEGWNTIKFKPPAIITKTEVDHALEVFEYALGKASE